MNFYVDFFKEYPLYNEYNVITSLIPVGRKRRFVTTCNVKQHKNFVYELCYVNFSFSAKS